MSGRDEQLGKEKAEPQSRQGTAREAGRATTADPRPREEKKAEADLLKTSGGDPLTQEG